MDTKMKSLRPLIVVFGWFLVSLAGYAQTPSGIATTPPSKSDLGTALATVALPTGRIFLIVSAETIPLPQDTQFPPEKSSLTTVTDTYQRSVRAFGAVTAIAPPTMFVLNTDPGEPDIYADIQPEDAFKMLAASLSDTQWKALTGENGLGLSDLASEDQHQLFQALFPGGTFKVNLVYRNADTPNAELDLSHELSQVRLRLSQSIAFGVPTKDGGATMNSGSGYSRDPHLYQWEHGSSPSNNLYGVPQNAEIPNTLKPSQLNWDLPALRTPVPLSGLKTVGELIGRVGQLTHLELYADKRYESKSLMILGGNEKSAPAADLLRSLTFCVCGAFRQVGPAYVLTDDVMGTQMRKAILKQFELETEQRINEQKDKAADIMAAKHSFSELVALDNPLALNSDEEKKIVPTGSGGGISGGLISLPFAQLTPAQQESARREADAMAEEYQNAPEESKPDLSGDFMVATAPHLDLIVPSLNAPVTTDFHFFSLFNDSPQRQQERVAQFEQSHPEASSPLAQVITLASHRAILVKPTSLADLTSEIAAMKDLGFNQLWLSVFSEGHLQTMAPDGKDLLAAALHLTHSSNIQVYAVVDLFQWSTDAPTNAVDVDVLGETSAQAEARLQSEAAIEADANGHPVRSFKPASGLSVIPFNPEVSSRLMTLMKSLAKRPGLAGIILRRTAPGGYDEDRNAVYMAPQPDLGYIVPSRLAFLRQAHSDPIDITKVRVQSQSGPQISRGTLGGAMGDVSYSLNSGVLSDPATTIPGFNDQSQDALLSVAWDKYRRDADVNVLRSLYDAIQVSSPNLPIFVQQQHHNFTQDWYGSWDSRNTPLPEWQTLFVGSQMVLQEDRSAKMQSHVVQVGLGANDAHDLSGLSSVLEGELRDSTWDGFVWDITALNPSVLNPQASTVPSSPLTK